MKLKPSQQRPEWKLRNPETSPYIRLRCQRAPACGGSVWMEAATRPCRPSPCPGGRRAALLPDQLLLHVHRGRQGPATLRRVAGCPAGTQAGAGGRRQGAAGAAEGQLLPQVPQVPVQQPHLPLHFSLGSPQIPLGVFQNAAEQRHLRAAASRIGARAQVALGEGEKICPESCGLAWAVGRSHGCSSESCDSRRCLVTSRGWGRVTGLGTCHSPTGVPTGVPTGPLHVRTR